MNLFNNPPLFSLCLFLGMIACFHIARYLSRQYSIRTNDAGYDSEATSGITFALFGLLMAFVFSGAYARFDDRRNLIVDEANAIGTAYLRVDLLPAEAQPALRKAFKEYTQSRIQFYEHLGDRVAATADLNRSAQLQQIIWQTSIQASTGSENNATRLLLIPALNDMIDIVTTRTVAVQKHPPALLYTLLGSLGLLCAWLAGHSARKSDKPLIFQSIAFALVISSVLYLTMDVEYPGQGLITLDSANQVMVDVLNSMH